MEIKWKPIETAPKDGTSILLCNNRETTVGIYMHDGREFPWVVFDGHFTKEPLNGWSDNKFGPTHWMPLPDPPKK